MEKEVFLLKGIHPKQTGKVLGLLSKNNFPKINHIKRVKNLGKNCNLVIIDKIPEEIKHHFILLFTNHEESFCQIQEVEPSAVLSNLKHLPLDDSFVLRVSPFVSQKEENESFHLLRIKREQVSLVRV